MIDHKVGDRVQDSVNAAESQIHAASPILDFGTLSRVSNVFKNLGRVARFPDYLLKYRQLQIVMTTFNQIFYFNGPFLMGVGLVASCVLGYEVIKLSHQVPLPLTLLSIFVFILIILSAHGLAPVAAIVSKKSEIFISFWKQQGVSKYRSRQLKSLPLLQFNVGPFFKITRDTRRVYMSLVLYYTVSLIISI